MVEFSVLMSVYKNENAQYLKESVESVSLNQSITPSEIILVKDGKLTEDLDNIISTLKNNISYLKVFGYDENKGLGFALAYGLELCSNELIFRMDTDDIALNNRFETQLKFIKNADNLAVIGTKIEEFSKIPGDLKQFRTVPIDQLEIQSNKNRRNPFNHMSVLFRKSVIEEVGGYISLPGYEDYYLWLRVLNKYDGLNLDTPLVHARIGNNLMARRQGYIFFIKEFNFQNKIYQENYISLYEYIRNILLRCVPRLLPAVFLTMLYKVFLRR